MNAPASVLLLFLDGVGIGPAGPANPFAAATLPVLRTWLGGRLPLQEEVGASGRLRAPSGAYLVAADAGLGQPGRPQSGTGQTSLLTGINAAARFGRHFGSWVPVALRDTLERENLLSRVGGAGRSACFANAYPLRLVPAMLARRPAAPPLAARAAGVLVRDAAELRAGTAVASSITNEGWRDRLGADVPLVSPADAGETLARLAAQHAFTLFAHYDTDLVGHRREMAGAVGALEKVDAFLGGLLGTLSDATLLLVASDHGNIEDVRVGHTENRVPVIAYGPGAAHLADRVDAITDVAPAILDLLDLR
jgi:2,3-bisphosphoglycerate-independent phosphoglycerate mutase